MSIEKTTCFQGVCGLQTMRLNVTFTSFGAFKLRKLFVHFRKTPNILTQHGSNLDAQVVCDMLGVFTKFLLKNLQISLLFLIFAIEIVNNVKTFKCLWTKNTLG